MLRERTSFKGNKEVGNRMREIRAIRCKGNKEVENRIRERRRLRHWDGGIILINNVSEKTDAEYFVLTSGFS